MGKPAPARVENPSQRTPGRGGRTPDQRSGAPIHNGKEASLATSNPMLSVLSGVGLWDGDDAPGLRSCRSNEHQRGDSRATSTGSRAGLVLTCRSATAALC